MSCLSFILPEIKTICYSKIVLCHQSKQALRKTLLGLSLESVVMVRGKVQLRPKGQENKVGVRSY